MPSYLRAMGVFRFDLGCDLIASQDFVILSLFKKCSAIISVDVYLNSGTERTRKRLWNEEKKISPNHLNAKRKSSVL